jgi:hypothetical protein
MQSPSGLFWLENGQVHVMKRNVRAAAAAAGRCLRAAASWLAGGWACPAAALAAILAGPEEETGTWQSKRAAGGRGRPSGGRRWAATTGFRGWQSYAHTSDTAKHC